MAFNGRKRVEDRVKKKKLRHDLREEMRTFQECFLGGKSLSPLENPSVLWVLGIVKLLGLR